jgi:hypothetical protein
MVRGARHSARAAVELWSIGNDVAVADDSHRSRSFFTCADPSGPLPTEPNVDDLPSALANSEPRLSGGAAADENDDAAEEAAAGCEDATPAEGSGVLVENLNANALAAVAAAGAGAAVVDGDANENGVADAAAAAAAAGFVTLSREAARETS